ncbi:MAG TPA: 2-isopropylmalate synthase [Polyangiaceae bacterium]|nr:2-isopropylmalate synthase [Polyangiaceae bacterium]
MPAFTTDADRAGEFIYDWNDDVGSARRAEDSRARAAGVVDETLRDGLQNPSVVDPPIEDKLRILHRMEELGIDDANIGLPGSSPRAFDDALRLCREVVQCRMKIRISAAGRTVLGDITPMIEISQRTGLRLEVCAFIGSSPIRQYVERWDVAFIARRSSEAIDVAVRAGLPVTYVTEDTTRSRPDALETLFRSALDHGATRLVLSDTVGHATPEGVRALLAFTKRVVASSGHTAGIDWHGHNDRGLALSNALLALDCGADRVHGTALGIGERVGNAPIELLLLNLRLSGKLAPDRDLTTLVSYCEEVARAVGWVVPPNYPLVGRDAFRTTTGVHAAAIVKALELGDVWLVDRVYSSVPAGTFGRSQEIGIGFMSGASNVNYWLRTRGIDPNDALVEAILRAAKARSRTMTEDEVMAVVESMRPGPAR